ncbi:unnamed protein product [Owenia fusiformis]|uniref:Uncharacterized protein n=1 Tax=Owenia fusiformis TaxID=6347 RepID=A0A8J1U2R3_OWEFU|nr:unnamed protein product [Owenia fusiformis]
MAESRRSGRARKTVDYSQFGGAEENSDDDFADATPTPPPMKKSKLSTKDKKKKKKKEKRESPKKTKRPALDDKLYERDLQAALELSKSQSESQDTEHVESEGTDTTEPVDADKIEVIQEGIPVSESDTETPGHRSRRPHKKAKFIDDSDDEFKAESDLDQNTVSEDDSDDSFSSDSDDDFGSRKHKKSKRGRKKVKKPTAVSPSKPKPRLNATITSINTHKGGLTPKGRGGRGITSRSSTAIDTSSPHVTPSRTSSGALFIRKPNWAPPGPAGSKSDDALKSPSTGIRIGLSKHIRLKPLHANVKVPR